MFSRRWKRGCFHIHNLSYTIKRYVICTSIITTTKVVEIRRIFYLFQQHHTNEDIFKTLNIIDKIINNIEQTSILKVHE